MSDRKLMVVNDDAAFFERIRDGIAAASPEFEVFNVVSGPRAVGLAGNRKPDVIILDADMVGVDGYSLCEQLKADEAAKDIPVIILATDPNEASALRARKVGAAAHMPESVDVSALLEKCVSLMPAEEELAAAAGAEGEILPISEVPADSYGVPQPVDSPGYGTLGPPPTAGPSAGAAQVVGMHTRYEGGVGADPKGDRGLPHIDELLRMMIDDGGSDLHITVGSPPGMRIRGELRVVEGQPVLTPRDTQEMLLTLLSEEQRKRFEVELELDFAYSIPSLSRFRANVFQQRGAMGAVFRAVPIRVPTMQELGLPKVCKYLAERPRGLVLVTGPTGSGKSTTLAAMIDHINDNRAVHIITMEDPIEFMHKNKKAFVNQREVGEDTHSFSAALKRVLRQDPDVILVGEMRDLETISAALTAAETGHLVLATLHTTGGPESVDRIIDVFPPHQQQQVRMQLSNTLEGVLSQTLLRSTDGRTRVMAMEIMLGIPAISNLIREGKTHQMATIIQGGASLGMQTLDQHLKMLLQGGKITFEEAIGKAKSPRELAQLVGRKI